MLVVGLDLETTGFEFDKDQITELGAVLWDTDNGGVPLQIVSEFVYEKNYPEVTEEITGITGITTAMLKRYGKPLKIVNNMFHGLLEDAEAIVAHNGNEFDRPMLESKQQERKLAACTLPWIDTMIDLPYPPKMKGRQLGHLAADHGFLNPFRHRAVFDVLTMLLLLNEYDPIQVLAHALEPKITIGAKTTFEQRDKPKSLGFSWRPAPTKIWIKQIRESQLQAERQACLTLGFDITVIKK